MTGVLTTFIFALVLLVTEAISEGLDHKFKFGRLRPFLRTLFFFTWAYVYWLVGLMGFGLSPAVLAIAIGSALTVLLLYFYPPAFKEWRLPHWTSVSVFLCAFLFVLGIRGFFPDIHQTEKFTDLMFLQSVLHARSFPPEDLWFSGEPVNYYYFGYVFFAPLLKILRLAPEFAYQVSFALLIGLMAETFYGLGRFLGLSRIAAVFAAAILLFGGNLEWIRQVPFSSFAEFNWWTPSRIMEGAINEFPAWSILLGDLHPHVISLPIALCFLALQEEVRKSFAEKGFYHRLAWTSFLALLLGAFYALHPWTLPILALFFAWRWKSRPKWVVWVAFLSFVFFLPYWMSYEGPQTKFGWVPKNLRSTVSDLMLHWGLFFLVLLWILPRDVSKKWKSVVGVLLGLLLFGWIFGPAPAVLAFFLVWSFWTMLKEKTFSMTLIALSLGLLLLCEFVFLGGVHGEKMLRFNTVFKIYFFVWPVFGISLLAQARVQKVFSPKKNRGLAKGILVGASMSALVFPIFGLGHRLEGRAYEWQLDGMRFLRVVQPGEAEAISFLRNNAASGDVLLEAIGPAYRTFGRFATFAGLPTPLAWQNHQSVWRRNGWHRSQERKEKIASSIADPSRAEEILKDDYQVRWIVDGHLERRYYTKAFRKFLESDLDLRFENAYVKVYEWK